jgi:predicted membrane protein
MNTSMPKAETVTTPEAQPPGLHWPSLMVGVGLMLLLSVYPPLLTDALGHADHTLAGVLLWAMSAGLVSGVGFVPRWWGWRALLGGWACALALLTAAALKALG